MFIIKTYKGIMINFNDIKFIKILNDESPYILAAFSKSFELDESLNKNPELPEEYKNTYCLYCSNDLEDVERNYNYLLAATQSDCIGYDFEKNMPIYPISKNTHSVVVRYSCRTCENDKCMYYKNRCWGDEFEHDCKCFQDKEPHEQGIKIYDRCIYSKYATDMLDITQAQKIEYSNSGRCEMPPYDRIIDLKIDNKDYANFDIFYLKIDNKVIFEAKEQE